jgi:hypothetical protein
MLTRGWQRIGIPVAKSPLHSRSIRGAMARYRQELPQSEELMNARLPKHSWCERWARQLQAGDFSGLSLLSAGSTPGFD